MHFSIARTHCIGAGLLMFAIAAASAAPGAQPARLASVIDGDTMTVLTKSGRLTVRLAGVDAPDLKQRNGIRARQALIALCSGEDISVEARGAAKPLPARVSCGKRDVAAELVGQGLAWVTPDAGEDAVRLKPLQDAARDAKRGLWAEANPVPPWEWKRMEPGTGR